MRAGIIGVGSALPERILTNKDLERFLDTSDAWISTRTGISERRIIDDNEGVSDLAARAATAAIHNAGLALANIDFILMASASPETVWPSTACLTQAKLGLVGVPALDIQAACSGFTYGLTLADSLAKSGQYRNILLIGAEAMSRYLDWRDRNTCVLFGDAAAAVVVARVDNCGIIDNYLGANGEGADILKISTAEAGSLAKPEQLSLGPVVAMNGREVYRFAVKTVKESIDDILTKHGLNANDLDFLLLHQANQRINDQITAHLDIDADKVPSNIARYGNTSSASIPLLMDELVSQGKLRAGHRVLTVGFGAGLTWGANLIEWC